MSRLPILVLCLLIVVGVAGARLWGLGSGGEERLTEAAAQTCRAVAERRFEAALASSHGWPSLDTPAGRELSECRCWALRSLDRMGECVAFLDASLAPIGGPGEGADWIPPAPLVRPVIRQRLDRSALEEATQLARRSARAHPTSLHLLELDLESRIAVAGEERAFADFAASIAEREQAGAGVEARLVLGISRLRRGEPEAALRALGPEPPPAGHPQLSAWLHNRVNAEAAAGDLAAVRKSMRLWAELGAKPAELRARYAVSLSLAGLPDPEQDFVDLLRGAIGGREEIGDPLIVSWLYQRLIAHLIAEERLAEALEAYDEGSAVVQIESITRGEIARGVAVRAAAASGDESDMQAGRIVFRLPRGAAQGELLVSAGASQPADADYEAFEFDRDGAIAVERSLGHWPVRWVYRDRAKRPLASGHLWPVPAETTVASIELGRASEPARYAAGERLPGDGRRRIFTLILDCADWRLVQYLRARGELPVLEALLVGGRRAVLRSDPPLTAAAMEALVWPDRHAGIGVLGWMHRMGTELGGLEGVGVNHLGFLEHALPRSDNFFEVVGAGSHVAANMLFSHGAIDAGQHAEVVGPDRTHRSLDLSHVLRRLGPTERVGLLGLVSTPRYERQLERIAGELDAVIELIEAGEVDLLMARVEALDLLTHSLFSPLVEGGQDDGRPDLLDVYRYIDHRLAEVHRALDADDLLVVMSDHGIRNAMEHEEDALFVAVGAGITPGRAEGRPDLRGVPRVLADWLGVETDWPDSAIAAPTRTRHAGR